MAPSPAGCAILAVRTVGLNHGALFFFPILMTWFAHRRLVRREFLALWVSVALFCLPFVLLAARQTGLPTATDWGGGIMTLQIPISLVATALLSHLEMVWRLPGPWVVSVLVGEVLLTPTWIS